jgi:hypothetical protein
MTRGCYGTNFNDYAATIKPSDLPASSADGAWSVPGQNGFSGRDHHAAGERDRWSGVNIGDTVLVVNKTTKRSQECRVVYRGKDHEGKPQAAIAFAGPIPNFWRVTRREKRVAASIPIRVRGVDPEGNAFTQSAQAVDVSRHGARLDGIGYVTRPGETIEVKRRWQSARYRVLWVGHPGTPEAGQAGVYALQPGKNPWGIDLS